MRARWVVVVVLAACGDTRTPDALLVTAPEPPGANCAYGGTKVESGQDANDNGVLDPG